MMSEILRKALRDPSAIMALSVLSQEVRPIDMRAYVREWLDSKKALEKEGKRI